MTVLNNSDNLTECVNRALVELEERKSRIGAETLVIDDRLQAIRDKMERLGMAFADGAVSESAYKSKLNQLKKQEASLLKCRHNIDPSQLTELVALENRITEIEDVLSRGGIVLSEFGIFALTEDHYAPVGFNAWRESETKLAIGEVTEMDIFQMEGSDKKYRGIGAPAGFLECTDPRERTEIITRNMRAIMQLFNIKVLVYPERVEIQGAIPTQVLGKSTEEEPGTALIISSPSLGKGGGGI